MPVDREVARQDIEVFSIELSLAGQCELARRRDKPRNERNRSSGFAVCALGKCFDDLERRVLTAERKVARQFAFNVAEDNGLSV